jgi:hypothetical protein
LGILRDILHQLHVEAWKLERCWRWGGLGLDHLVWRLILWNLLNWQLLLRGISLMNLLRILLNWRLLLRGISLKNLLRILLSVILNSSVVISLIVGTRVRVILILTVLLCHKLCNKVITILDHPLLLIIEPMELLDLMHSLSQCTICSHSQPHLLSQSSSRFIAHLVIHMNL